MSIRTTNQVLDTVTARTALRLASICGSVPAKSTSIRSPAMVTAARMVTPSPTSKTSVALQVPSGIADTAARTRRSL